MADPRLSITAEPEAGTSPPPAFTVPFASLYSTEMSEHQIPDALSHMRENSKRPLPRLKFGNYRPDTLLICAGGHSIKENLDLLRQKHDAGNPIIAINDTYDWLVEQGIVPEMFAFCEIDPWPKEFVKHARKETTFYVPSLAHSSALDRLKDFNVVLWHLWMGIGENEEVCGEKSPLLIGGGESMAMRCPNLGIVLGFRNMEMFGVDGSFPAGAATHVYHDRRNNTDVPGCTLAPGIGNFWYHGRVFESHYCYARQAIDLHKFCSIWQHTFRLKVHGDGFVAYVHRTNFPQQYQEHPPLMDMDGGFRVAV
jgi:hypothetical protein